MERIVIPGKATYTPISLTDLMMAAPLASRILLGATLPGQILAAASFGYYAGSAARDWFARLGVRPIDFQAAFGADVRTLESMPLAQRRWELTLLGHALNRGYSAEKPSREALVRRCDRHLTAFIAGITGQEVITSTRVRGFNLAKMVMPSALGVCDVVSGDIAIFADMGPLEPHVITHELCHRKGYLKELHAQALAYLALRGSGDPYLIQSARLERLYRQIRVIQRRDPEAPTGTELLGRALLRKELHEAALSWVTDEPPSRGPATVMLDARMRVTGQNGLSDYDEGFTDFLWTFSRSEQASQPTGPAAI